MVGPKHSVLAEGAPHQHLPSGGVEVYIIGSVGAHRTPKGGGPLQRAVLSGDCGGWWAGQRAWVVTRQLGRRLGVAAAG